MHFSSHLNPYKFTEKSLEKGIKSISQPSYLGSSVIEHVHRVNLSTAQSLYLKSMRIFISSINTFNTSIMNDFPISITRNFRNVRLYLSIVLLVLASTMIYAQTNTITWTGLASADWHDADNWAPMTVPTATDSVVINGFLSEPSPQVLSNNTAEANSVTIALGAQLTIQISAQLDVTESANQGISISGNLINIGTIEVSSGKGVLISGGNLTNDGTFFSFVGSDYSIVLDLNATLTNNPCGNFQLFSPINNSGAIINDGLFGLITGESSTFGSFTNNGFIEQALIPVPPTALTNNGIIADFTTFLTEGTDTITNAFQVGATPLYNISGVFFDGQQTMPAGTYDALTNSFITVSNFPFGISNLTVVIQDQVNGCTRQVGWTIDKRCDFTPETSTNGIIIVDRIWNIDGPDSLWSNPYNWCPFGVPLAGESIELPISSVVYYDTNGQTINNLNNRGSLIVKSGQNLRIENQTPRSLFFNYGIIENYGEISLSNGQGRGLLNQGDGIIHNYGDINIDNVAISIQNFQAFITNRGYFTNHTGANILLSDSKSFGFENDLDGSFINQSGASLTMVNIDSTGIHLRNNSYFENMDGGIINLSGVKNPSCKVQIDTGAEVIWNPSVDIQN